MLQDPPTWLLTGDVGRGPSRHNRCDEGGPAGRLRRGLGSCFSRSPFLAPFRIIFRALGQVVVMGRVVIRGVWGGAWRVPVWIHGRIPTGQQADKLAILVIVNSPLRELIWGSGHRQPTPYAFHLGYSYALEAQELLACALSMWRDDGGVAGGDEGGGIAGGEGQQSAARLMSMSSSHVHAKRHSPRVWHHSQPGKDGPGVER